RLARVRRGEHGGCLTLAEADELGVSGTYAIVARRLDGEPGEVGSVPLMARIVTSRATAPVDLLALLVLLVASAAWTVVLALRPRKPAPDSLPGEERVTHRASGILRRPDLRAMIAWLVLALALFAVGFVSGMGPFAAVIGAGILAAVQLGSAYTLAAPHDRAATGQILALGLDSRRAYVYAALAPLVGFALVFIGRYASGLVPSTAESAIEAFVASRSGYLAVACSALFLPIVEELFFRGLLYGLLERAWGAPRATVAVVLAFPLLHLPQVAGAWGALVSLALTGLGLTLLRRASGSVVPSTIAHLTHNAAVTLIAFPIG
ncbi:MAG: CPBP family intramembrane metalloprotease, partial [Polyangiaceae bacterium]|nr:CPBP family intramembrane metalloprotease [Polyangiaceae bacterium]